MVRMTLQVNGMACGMCESHINDTIRQKFSVKKVTSSHTKGVTEILADAPLDEEALKSAIAATGYTVTGIRTEPYEKKHFALFKH